MFPIGQSDSANGRVHLHSLSSKERPARSASPEVASPRSADRIARQTQSPAIRSYSESSLQHKRPRQDRSLFEPIPESAKRTMQFIRADLMEDASASVELARRRNALPRLAARRKAAKDRVDRSDRNLSLTHMNRIQGEMMLSDIESGDAEYLCRIFDAPTNVIKPHIAAQLVSHMAKYSKDAELYEHAVIVLLHSARLPDHASPAAVLQRQQFIDELVSEHRGAVVQHAQALAGASSSHGPSYIQHIAQVEISKAIVDRSAELLQRLDVPGETFSTG